MSVALPKAILFDLDDTIISLGGRVALLEKIAEELGPYLAPHTPVEVAIQAEQAFQVFWGTPGLYVQWRNDLLTARKQILTELFCHRLDLGEAVATEFAERFHRQRETSPNRLFPGAVSTLEALRARGIRLALVTNGHADSQRAKVRQFDLARHFNHVQIEGEVGFGKPEERAYQHAMTALAVQPHDTWIVGDHLEWEVTAPQRLGIFAVWHDHAGKGLPAGSSAKPDHIIQSIPELLELLP